jgi:hypothetical protein
MKKRINNIVAVIFVLGLILFLVNIQKRNDIIESKIQLKGYYSFAVISDLVASSGSTRSVYYTYTIYSSIKKGHDYVSKEFYKQKNIGDTIVIKFLKEDTKKSLIIEDKEFQKYMLKEGKIWKNTPAAMHLQCFAIYDLKFVSKN